MTNFDEFFSKPEYQIPIEFNSDDLKEEISALLGKYITDLKKEGVSQEVVNKVRKFRHSCSYFLSNYLKGIHSLAYNNFCNAFSNLELSDSPLVKGTIGADVLFRGRINKDIEDYSEDEMYHIPLTKRGVVSSQRYSFPGLPCLYVGASVYTCWVELNRPSFENFQVATILPAKEVQKMNVFDLSNIPQRLSELRKEPWFNENEYFCYWPLMALSSIKVRHENDIFNPEYIFPQFLLEYVLNNNKTNQYIGIKYPSVKVAAICNKQFCEDWHTYVSYVFPSRTPNMKDIRCKTLENWFSVGHNRSGRELKVLADLISYDESKIKLYNLDTEDSLQRILFKQLQGRRIFTHDAKTYPYNESTYGMIEVAIQLEDFNVNNNPRLGDVCKVNEWDDDKV